MIALKGFQAGWSPIPGSVDALHFHRCVKNLADAGRKVRSARRAGQHPALHVSLNERTLVLRSEQTEYQNFFAFRTRRTFCESDCVANINRHSASSRSIAHGRIGIAAGKILYSWKTVRESTREQGEGQLPKSCATVDCEENGDCTLITRSFAIVRRGVPPLYVGIVVENP